MTRSANVIQECSAACVQDVADRAHQVTAEDGYPQPPVFGLAPEPFRAFRALIAGICTGYAPDGNLYCVQEGQLEVLIGGQVIYVQDVADRAHQVTAEDGYY